MTVPQHILDSLRTNFIPAVTTAFKRLKPVVEHASLSEPKYEDGHFSARLILKLLPGVNTTTWHTALLDHKRTVPINLYGPFASIVQARFIAAVDKNNPKQLAALSVDMKTLKHPEGYGAAVMDLEFKALKRIAEALLPFSKE